MRLILYQVPLVDNNHQRLVVLLDELEDVHILCLDASCGVNHQDTDVTVLDGTDGAHHAVELKVLCHLILTTDTCGVDQIEVEAELVVFGINRVAGSTGNISHDVAILTDEGIDDARLTSIGASNDGKAGHVVLDVICLIRFEFRQHMVQQVASTRTGSSADTERVAQSELIELILSIQVFTVVSLVGNEHDRQLRTAQYEGHILVKVGQTVLDIYQEQHQVSLFSGHNHLLTNLLLEDVVTVDHPTASIYYRELAAIPLALAILAVACGTCLVAHDGSATVGQSVKQGGLAYIRASYYRY